MNLLRAHSVKRPTLHTPRITLRPFTLADAPALYTYLNDKETSRNLGYIPYPYVEGMAEEWIATHESEFVENRQVIFCISDARTQAVMGSMGLVLNFDMRQAELGYWIGRPFWGKGYGTEAARRVVQYAMAELPLIKIYARPFAYNLASQRLLEKSGFVREAVLRKHFCKWGEMLDMAYYAFIRDENTVPE